MFKNSASVKKLTSLSALSSNLFLSSRYNTNLPPSIFNSQVLPFENVYFPEYLLSTDGDGDISFRLNTYCKPRENPSPFVPECPVFSSTLLSIFKLEYFL